MSVVDISGTGVNVGMADIAFLLPAGLTSPGAGLDLYAVADFSLNSFIVAGALCVLRNIRLFIGFGFSKGSKNYIIYYTIIIIV